MRTVRLLKSTKSVTSVVTLVCVLGCAAATFALSAQAVPPAPVITGHPVDPSPSTTATFRYTDAKAVVGFRCALDKSTLAACARTGRSFTHLAYGSHCFHVVAVGTAAAQSKATTFCWHVVVTTHLGIGGVSTNLLAPGVTLPVNLKFSNPYAFKLKIIGVTVTVQSTTTKGGRANPACDGRTNLKVVRAFRGSVTVPAHASRTLADLGVPAASWPLVQMPDLSTNQDACKGATFAFSYAELATQ